MLARSYSKETRPAQDKLVESHLNLVRKIAWHLHGRVGRRVEIDDLLQVGYMGLIDASQRYVAQPGVTFASYAAIRIRGSIIDYLRSSSSLCRASISMQQRIRATVQKLEQQLMRAAEPPEIAAALNMPVQEYENWKSQLGAGQIQSLDEIYSDHSILFNDGSLSVEDKMQHDGLRRLLRQSMEDLPEREALVLQLYYVEELNVYEIGEIMGVTTGRVSQIKKAAVERLRDGITRRSGDDD